MDDVVFTIQYIFTEKSHQLANLINPVSYGEILLIGKAHRNTIQYNLMFVLSDV